MAANQFTVGMVVRPIAEVTADVDPDHTDPCDVVGKVLIAHDYNGDIHVDFPHMGVAIFRPEELEIVNEPQS